MLLGDTASLPAHRLEFGRRSRAIPQGCAKPFRQAFDRGRSDRSKTDVDRAGPKVAGSRQTHGSSLCISRAWVGPDVTGSSTSGGIGLRRGIARWLRANMGHHRAAKASPNAGCAAPGAGRRCALQS
jgi:hypothetical protein